ncbi:MAG TPA: hypothetical protein PK231_06305, partial [Acidocella sp.]|nr:hypothetical protein [Acidocella sp.]
MGSAAHPLKPIPPPPSLRAPQCGAWQSSYRSVNTPTKDGLLPPATAGVEMTMEPVGWVSEALPTIPVTKTHT